MNVISSRPHVQGFPTPLHLKESPQELTDGAGLSVLRRQWDRLGLGAWIDERAAAVPGYFRPSMMAELWVSLLWYGGGWLDDVELLSRRCVRRIFGWERVPHPTTLGRWLRRAGASLLPVVNELIEKLVEVRWARVGVRKAVTLAVDSTVSVRHGRKQAGAEVGYNPHKPGRPSHRPLLAYVVETGDLLGLLWRPGSAGSSAGILEWLPELVAFLRRLGVEQITVRLDKGFPSRELVRLLEELDVRFFLKVQNHYWVRRELGTWRPSKRADGIFKKAEAVYTNSGRLWGVRLLSLQGRRPLSEAEEEGLLELDTYEVTDICHILTNVSGIHALTAWRTYNQGVVIEQRIKEMGQLSVGKTAVDDVDGNRLLWALGGLAYQLLHLLRRQLSGIWRYAQPKSLRKHLFQGPAKFTRTGGQTEFQLPAGELAHGLLPRVLRKLAGERDPPLPLAA